jgi:hypothetical protein
MADCKFKAPMNAAFEANLGSLDIIHLGRETMWQPQEGRIPDPLPISN